ncbi:MAG: DUF6476 family protein [Alphaproteobacteria bacterium]|nr:DUF6476 family protein [Alphaproteobacteria bacterium]
MQALKALVVFMGVLLIVGLVALVYLIATGAHKSMGERPLAAPAAVPLAAGERVVETRPDGDRLYLRLQGPQGARILILSSETGEPLGELLLQRP